MTGATHLLTGSLIYVFMRGNKLLSPVFALGSHFLLDAIPHFDNSAWNFPLGFLAILFLLLTTKRTGDPFILISALFGILPDVNHIVIFNETMLDLHQVAHFKKTFEIPIDFLYTEMYACLAACYLIWTRYPAKVLH
ncbi:MAG TPA: hypothetical protein GXX59_04395 [Syntrophomonadaceae bacterium]|nr:hypothetical protein [Syntrophomonadaceae bacterium]